MKAEIINKHAIRLIPENQKEREVLESMRYEIIQVSGSSAIMDPNEDREYLQTLCIRWGEFGKIYETRDKIKENI